MAIQITKPYKTAIDAPRRSRIWRLIRVLAYSLRRYCRQQGRVDSYGSRF